MIMMLYIACAEDQRKGGHMLFGADGINKNLVAHILFSSIPQNFLP